MDKELKAIEEEIQEQACEIARLLIRVDHWKRTAKLFQIMCVCLGAVCVMFGWIIISLKS